MLGLLILKFKYSSKSEEQQFCSLDKTSYLYWGNEYDYFYIIPTITIYTNDGFGISFYWLKIQYGCFWSIRTYEDEDLIAEAKRNKNNKNES